MPQCIAGGRGTEVLPGVGCLGLVRRYVDVILELTEKAGEFVSDDIWYRVIHMVTNNEELQVQHPTSITMTVTIAVAVSVSSTGAGSRSAA